MFERLGVFLKHAVRERRKNLRCSHRWHFLSLFHFNQLLLLRGRRWTRFGSFWFAGRELLDVDLFAVFHLFDELHQLERDDIRQKRNMKKENSCFDLNRVSISR